MAKHLLDVQDLEVSFHTYAGEIKAVRGVSFYLDEGETLAIVGESGCGKSVTVQSIMKLIPSPPMALKGGKILYNDEDLSKLTDQDMERYCGKELSMIFQDAMTSLNPTMRVGAQMCEGMIKHQKITKEVAKKRAIHMLNEVGMPNPEEAFYRYPHTFSGGQRQRIMIAMAITCHPKILFADEPTTALDVTMQAQILDIIKNLKERMHTAVVLITHDLGVVARMADRVAVMYAGKIVEYGNVRDIFYHPSHPYTWGLLGSMPNLNLERKSELYAIKGTPPDLFSPPEGCAFAARCVYAMGACHKQDAPSFVCAGDQEHYAHCWLLDERAEAVTPPRGLPELKKGGRKDATEVTPY